MVTFRDRTNLYLSYRQSYPHHQAAQFGIGGFNAVPLVEEQQGLMDPISLDQGEYGIEMDNLPPSWVDIADQVQDCLNEVDKKCTELDSYHRKNMLPGFDDRTKEEKQIEQTTFDITSNLHKCQALVKNLDKFTHEITDPAELKMANNMKVALATKVQESSTKFRKMQSAYLKSLRVDAFPSLDVQTTSNPYGSDLQQEEDLDIASAQSTLQQSSMLVETEDLNIRQREQEITKLAQGILEIADLFKDLQTMVIDQGTLLDRIDYNLETMYVNVQQADKELTKGSHYQKRSQKCKIILLLVLIVVALIIILVIKPKHKNASQPEPQAPTRPSRPPTEGENAEDGK